MFIIFSPATKLKMFPIWPTKVESILSGAEIRFKWQYFILSLLCYFDPHGQSNDFKFYLTCNTHFQNTLCQGSKCFTSTELFNPYNNSMRQVLLLQPFHRWGHWRKWCVPVTQEIYYSDGTPIQVIGPWSLWSEPLCDAVSHVTGTIGRWKSRKLKWREDRLSTHWAGDNT